MRKFLVVVDETPECMNAMRFAARRAQKTGGGVVMLYVIAPDDFQHWVGVAQLMRQEARDAAEERLSELATELRALSGVTPEFAIRTDTSPAPGARTESPSRTRSSLPSKTIPFIPSSPCGCLLFVP